MFKTHVSTVFLSEKSVEHLLAFSFFSLFFSLDLFSFLSHTVGKKLPLFPGDSQLRLMPHDKAAKLYLPRGLRSASHSIQYIYRLLVDQCLPDPSANAMRRHTINGHSPRFALLRYDRSILDEQCDQVGDKTHDHIHAKRPLLECSMDHPSTATSEEHWDRIFRVSVA